MRLSTSGYLQARQSSFLFFFVLRCAHGDGVGVDIRL